MRSKGTLPNLDPLDGNSIIRTIDFWTNFSTRQSVFYIENTQVDDLHDLTNQINLNKNHPGLMLKIISLNNQVSLNLMIIPPKFEGFDLFERSDKLVRGLMIKLLS